MAYQITKECNGCGACAQWCPTRSIQGRKKQKYFILAENCIECGVCGRICPRGAVLDGNGGVQKRVILANWPKPEWDYLRCDDCGTCVLSCPVHCLDMGISPTILGQTSFDKPFLSKPRLCISCGFCARDCRMGAITMR